MKKIISLAAAFLLLTTTAFAAAPMDTAVKVVDYRNNVHSTPNSNAWGEAMYQTGNMAVYEATGSEKYLKYSLDWAKRANYSIDASAPSPEALLAADVYAKLYEYEQIPQLIETAKSAADLITEESCETIEAAYMSIPLLVKLGVQTENDEYFAKAEKMYKHLKATLYNEATKLFFEDKDAEKNDYYWARGNGFVLSAMVDLIEALPDGEFKAELTEDFKATAPAVFANRTQEGYYTRRLDQQNFYPGFETGGASYIIYALAKGVNMGLLDSKEYAPSLNAGFEFIKAAVKESGQVGFVQSRDSSGGDEGVALDGSATGGYATGAVMIVGIETDKMNSAITADMQMMRLYAEKMGYSLSYDNDTRTVSAVKGDAEICFEIGADSAEISGNEHPFTKEMKMYNDRVYLSKADLEKIFI